MINAVMLFWNVQVVKRYAVTSAAPTLIQTRKTFVEPTQNSTKRGMYLSSVTARNHICLAHFVSSTLSRAHVVSFVSIFIEIIFSIMYL